MANSAKYVWLDDGLKDAAQSGVPIVNAGLHYGFSVFEGIRCYATDRGPAIFRMEEHVDRLLDSALVVGFRNLPWTRDSPDRRDVQNHLGEQIFSLLHPPA